jgi:hypothetical protein
MSDCKVAIDTNQPYLLLVFSDPGMLLQEILIDI